MTQRLTDLSALEAHRKRASPGPVSDLHRTVRNELIERLSGVNKSFRSPVVVTPFAGVWHGALDGAQVGPPTDVLALGAGRHDLVVHAFALHWADDPLGQLIQCRRALRPDGLFLAATPGGRTLTELRGVLAEAETQIRGGLSPRVAPMAEIRDLGALLQRAGFAMPVADAEAINLTYGSLGDLMRDLRAVGETNALRDRDRRPPPRALFETAERLYAERFPAPDGRIQVTIEMIYLAGWAPSPEQPKALRPGSATARLADALGTTEQDPGSSAPPARD
ncbi:MAG: methyltransferase domain-containing protein [Pseudomonadota bacterium]